MNVNKKSVLFNPFQVSNLDFSIYFSESTRPINSYAKNLYKDALNLFTWKFFLFITFILNWHAMHWDAKYAWWHYPLRRYALRRYALRCHALRRYAQRCYALRCYALEILLEARSSIQKQKWMPAIKSGMPRQFSIDWNVTQSTYVYYMYVRRVRF